MRNKVTEAGRPGTQGRPCRAPPPPREDAALSRAQAPGLAPARDAGLPRAGLPRGRAGATRRRPGLGGSCLPEPLACPVTPLGRVLYTVRKQALSALLLGKERISDCASCGSPGGRPALTPRTPRSPPVRRQCANIRAGPSDSRRHTCGRRREGRAGPPSPLGTPARGAPAALGRLGCARRVTGARGRGRGVEAHAAAHGSLRGAAGPRGCRARCAPGLRGAGAGRDGPGAGRSRRGARVPF